MKVTTLVTGRDISDGLMYEGMVRDARKLALEDKLETPEKLATMTELEVCELLAKHYTIVFKEKECLGLVKHEDIEKFEKLVKTLCR